MGASIRIGRIAGVEIGINWSWLIVFGLITWSLAGAVFPHDNPGLSDESYLAMAVIAALAFFASILLHELGHAIEARRRGLQIAGVTLWLFGGVARFEGRFPDAGTEFRIAVAGPLVSLALGLSLTVAAASLELPSAFDGVVTWLGYINLSLLVFNLLPALPLDGGRILRAALWRSRRDFIAATRAAAAIGRGIGMLLIFGGLFLFITVGAFGGAWLAFIGWFLLQGARAEARYVATEQALSGLRVRDLMVADPVTVDADSTIGRFMDDVAWSQRFTTYPVLDGGSPVGLLAFASMAAVPRSEWDTRRVRDAIIPLDEVPLLTEEEKAVDALAELSAPRANRGLVVDNGHLAGLLSITDLARALEVGRRPAQAQGDRG